ncbi:MAG: hypothetical protein Q7R70_01145 [Candidatus Diapherotrites archaeon]|nr:hypothetical protein [Candidatus Diapherotrites archaeon]
MKRQKSRDSGFLGRLDKGLFIVLLAALAGIVLLQAMANISSDSVDYYAILQKTVSSPSQAPIVANLHFMGQRFPGYPLTALIPYAFAAFFIGPFVEKQAIIDVPKFQNQGIGNEGQPKELIPSRPLPIFAIFFKEITIKPQNGLFDWKIAFALLFTSFALLFLGIFFIAKTLLKEKAGSIAGISLAAIAVFLSPSLMQNAIQTPMYATLAAFGFSAIFAYFFINAFRQYSARNAFFAGIFLGALAITRLEGFVFLIVIAVMLALWEKIDLLKNLLLGLAPFVIILLAYNFAMFGNAFHFGFLAGDINKIGFDIGYAFANLANPASGILFYSPIVVLGIAGLFLSRKKHFEILGLCAIALIVLMLFRIPVMYSCTGENVIIGGVDVGCASTEMQKLALVQSDANRYVTVLIPFAVFGIRELIAAIFRKRGKRKNEAWLSS